MAVFDVTSPYDVRFLDMIVTDGDVSPEGLAAYHYRGTFYLAIANEVVGPGQTTSHTTLYRDGSGEGRRATRAARSSAVRPSTTAARWPRPAGAQSQSPARCRRYRSGMNARPLLAFIGITSWLAPAS